MSIIRLSQASLAFGHVALLDQTQWVLEPGQKVALIGRNGTGKSTLLGVIRGVISLDDGECWRYPDLKLGWVPQEPIFTSGESILDVVTQECLGDEPWLVRKKVDQILAMLKLDPDSEVCRLSGGEQKRVALAQALVGEPDVLLLDEPTNHLDVVGIEWLEEKLRSFKGSLVFVTHDRVFLERVATRIVELDRGQLQDFGTTWSEYQRRKELQYAEQEKANRRFDKLLAQEEIWIRQGVAARRTRNEGRVLRLEQLRKDFSARREVMGVATFAMDSGVTSGALVAELEHVSWAFGEKVILNDYSTQIQRGDKVGLIGANGSGKSTLLKILLGQISPKEGVVRLGTKLQIAYFDQMRSQLDLEATLIDTIAPGGDTVEINGAKKHVVSYLRDFLFPVERIKAKVKSLSGGERNRLLLARLFATPANILVLDEPTNDLDFETLELLENLLVDYQGTLLLVSHDRSFLDQVVTRSIVLEGDGRVTDLVGGYSDWVRYREAYRLKINPDTEKRSKGSSATRVRARGARLSQKEQEELTQLPNKIEKIERELEELNKTLSMKTFYQQALAQQQEVQVRQQTLSETLARALNRWEILESKNTPSNETV